MNSPETHISEWGRQHGGLVEMDKFYATEEREGGLRAIGDNVPGCQREDLSVLPPSEWEQRKREFSLDTWVEAALAAARK